MTEASSRPMCVQCGKPAFVMLDDVPVCIDCNYKFQQTQWMQFVQAATMANAAERDIFATVGMEHLATPIEIPPAPIPPLHYNNQIVNVTGGNVGAINFGTVHEIQVQLGTLTQHGETGVAEALANLTNGILSANEIAEAEKNELLERIAFLSAQASAPAAERKPGMVKTILGAFKDGALAISSMAGAWSAAEPILSQHFGLGV